MAARKMPSQPASDNDESGEGAPRAEQPGERRAIRIITQLEEIQGDTEKSIDARQLLMELPELSQRYTALLLREGPVSNAQAAKALKVEAPVLEQAILALERVVREIVADDD
jgi:hypothetical protein